MIGLKKNLKHQIGDMHCIVFLKNSIFKCSKKKNKFHLHISETHIYISQINIKKKLSIRFSNICRLFVISAGWKQFVVNINVYIQQQQTM